MKQFLENADGEREAEIECACGGKLKYQRRRAATIWSVFGKVAYKRAYYAGWLNYRASRSSLWDRAGQGDRRLRECFLSSNRGQKRALATENTKSTEVFKGFFSVIFVISVVKKPLRNSLLAHRIALSGIKESFDEGRKWLKEYLLFEVSENTIRSETQTMGELQRKADKELVKEMQDEKSLQQRERSQPVAPDILYGSIDAAKVRIKPRDPQEKAVENRETWRDLKAGCWYEGEVVPQQNPRHASVFFFFVYVERRVAL